LFVALAYRRLLSDLIAGGITRLRAGPFEFAWDQAKSGIERPRSAAKAKSRPDQPAAGAETPFNFLDSEVVNLASSDPREAVLRAYQAVREALRSGLEGIGVELVFNELDALGLAREAESRDIVPPEITDAVLGLNVLHNLALHAPVREMSPARAYEYLAMADGALYSFTAAMKKQHIVPAIKAAA
jgi:hypothetical protein